MNPENNETVLSIKDFPRDLRLALKAEAAAQDKTIREYIVEILVNRPQPAKKQ